MAPVASRVLFHQAHQLFFPFPFLKTGSLLSQHEKVGGMPVGDSTPGRTEIVQLELGRLIPVLQHTGVMLHDVDGAQLGVALKLDGPAHFATGIEAMNIASPSCHATNWRRTTDIGEQGASGIRESRLFEIVAIGIIIKHSGLPEKTIRTDILSALLVLYAIAAEIARNRRKKRPL